MPGAGEGRGHSQGAHHHWRLLDGRRHCPTTGIKASRGHWGRLCAPRPSAKLETLSFTPLKSLDISLLALISADFHACRGVRWVSFMFSSSRGCPPSCATMLRSMGACSRQSCLDFEADGPLDPRSELSKVPILMMHGEARGYKLRLSERSLT